jgi:cytochrome c oxidase subunit 4
MSETVEHQQHPLKIYFIVWIGLFILSACSYMVDYLNFQGELRWFLIIFFMWAKAGLIVAIFMHMRWERISLITAILVPPLCLAVFVFLMAIEGNYTEHTRDIAYTESSLPQAHPAPHEEKSTAH